MRVVRAASPGGNPPGPQARRPHPHGPAATRVGAAHGQETTQNPRGLLPLPCGHPRRSASRDMHAIVTGEPDARKRARPVRPGGRRKRTRLAGTSSAAYRNMPSGSESWPTFRRGCHPRPMTPWRDLWEPLIEIVRCRGIVFRWVKGHSGDPMNDLVDQLAVAARRTQRGRAGGRGGGDRRVAVAFDDLAMAIWTTTVIAASAAPGCPAATAPVTISEGLFTKSPEHLREASKACRTYGLRTRTESSSH